MFHFKKSSFVPRKKQDRLVAGYNVLQYKTTLKIRDKDLVATVQDVANDYSCEL